MKNKLRIKDIIFIVIIFIGLIAFVFQKFSHKKTESGIHEDVLVASALIDQKKVSVEIASTDEKRHLGLGNREALETNKGMLFIHDAPQKYPYSMRGMRFDLDFLFIRDGKVVDIAKNVAHEYQGKVIGATEYDKVLEVNAGWVRTNEIEIGDEVIFE